MSGFLAEALAVCVASAVAFAVVYGAQCLF